MHACKSLKPLDSFMHGVHAVRIVTTATEARHMRGNNYDFIHKDIGVVQTCAGHLALPCLNCRFVANDLAYLVSQMPEHCPLRATISILHMLNVIFSRIIYEAATCKFTFAAWVCGEVSMKPESTLVSVYKP
eukprot:6190366-Pleurochrysis_carterae.AAC.1